MMTPRALLLATALTATLSFSPTLAAPPTDARIDEVVSAFEKAWANATSREDIAKAAAEATQGLTLDELSAVQIGRLMSFQGLIDPLGGAPAALARLETFLDDKGASGATAAVHTMGRRLKAAEGDDAARLEIVRSTLGHPGLSAAIEAGGVTNFFSRLRAMGPLAKEAATEVLALDRLLTPDLAPKLATSFTSYYELLQSAAPDEKDKIEAARVKLVDLGRAALPKLSERESKFVAENVVDYLDGAFARGTLLNNTAPAVDVVWSSDPAITTLAALKDRVVIVDFWATWCGPCVASIPKIRELAARYEGYPVTIIGVTSIQGKHYGEGDPIDTKGNPEKEFALMAEYIQTKDITWPIVFTKQSCFNGAYGVRGIPHVTMIDPAGNVRHNNLHPGAPLADKAAMIDALLKEFNLPTPGPVADPAAEAPTKPTSGS